MFIVVDYQEVKMENYDLESGNLYFDRYGCLFQDLGNYEANKQSYLNAEQYQEYEKEGYEPELREYQVKIERLKKRFIRLGITDTIVTCHIYTVLEQESTYLSDGDWARLPKAEFVLYVDQPLERKIWAYHIDTQISHIANHFANLGKKCNQNE